MPHVTTEAVRKLLADLRRGRHSVDAAVRRLRALPFVKAGGALLDTHRALRCGFPEVVFCERKSPHSVARIARAARAAGQDLLATRATPEIFRAIKKIDRRARYRPEARIVMLGAGNSRKRPGIVVVAAGSSDRFAAEEARVTAEFFGNRVAAIHDVGVAGLHRLLAHLAILQGARVIVCVAGMEGALASVVGGLVACPVIAVPTSVGYGTHFKGVTTLLSMMSSCAANVVVVNIDNGFGAGYVAALINRSHET